MNKPLKIGLIMVGGRGWIGGSEYIKNIILALSSLPNEVKQTFEICLLYSKSSIDPDIYEQLEPCLSSSYNLDVELQPRHIFNRVIWKFREFFLKETNPRMLSFLKKSSGINFVYPYEMSVNGETPNLRGCCWISDFQHKYLPHFFAKSEITSRDKVFEKIAKKNSRIVLSSKSASMDFQKFYPNSKVKIEVLHFTTSLPKSYYEEDAVKTLNKYNLSDRFFLISNQFWQHKNHLVVLEALKILQDSYIYPMVVCTGHTYDDRNPYYIDSILQIIATYGLANQIHLLGLIPRIDQIQLMRCSLAVIQPSLFEGWSTVVEDARCLGKRMILSDLPVHLEQNPLGSIFFERNSQQQLANLIGEWWGKLPSGFNLEVEISAKEKNKKDVQKFGYRFLEIARSGSQI